MDTVYFGEQGLTSTSANYIAGKAAQYIQASLAYLNDVKFTTKTIQIVGSDKEHVMYSSANVEDLENIKEILNIVTQCYSLEAWLREAIKAKEEYSKELENTSLDDYLKMVGDSDSVPYPYKEDDLTADDIIKTWSVKDRARYYQLQTNVAVLGNNLFKGNMKTQRDNYYKRLNEPTVVTGQGRDTIIENYSCSLAKQTVDAFFMEMNEAHRKAQAELNGMLNTITLAIEKDKVEKQEKYQEELRLYAEWSNKKNAELKAWKLKQLAKARELKIIIPDRLKEIYGIVNNAGK